MPTSSLRIVVLDYPKLHLGDSRVQKVLSDLTVAKQLAYYRASEEYVCMGPLDMISIHVLVYDTQNLLDPKPVIGIRCTPANRAKVHSLPMPYTSYFNDLSETTRKRFEVLRQEKGEIVEANHWFVDPNFSTKATGMALSDILMVAMASYLMSRGYDHLIGGTNERFKGSRMFYKIGEIAIAEDFRHPMVQDPHKFLFLSKYSGDWLVPNMNYYETLLKNQWMLMPAEYAVGLKSLDQIRAEIAAIRMPSVA